MTFVDYLFGGFFSKLLFGNRVSDILVVFGSIIHTIEFFVVSMIFS